MMDVAKDRLAEIAPLQQALDAVWLTLKPHLERRRRKLVEELVYCEGEATRGRIKELDDLLALPEQLQQEAQSLTAAPQEEGDLP